MPMAATHRTDVYAPQHEQVLASATQWADAFAQQERRSTISIQPRRVTIRLPIDGGQVELTYNSVGEGLPRWAKPVLQSLAERWGSTPGWDTYHAKPTSQTHVVKLLNILSDLMYDDSRPPLITPLTDGGVQAEWHHNTVDLEIVVSADDNPTFYYFNRRTNEEQEGDLEPNYAHVQDLIGRVK